MKKLIYLTLTLVILGAGILIAKSSMINASNIENCDLKGTAECPLVNGKCSYNPN